MNNLVLMGDVAVQRAARVTLAVALVVAMSGFGVLWLDASAADGTARLEAVDSAVDVQRPGETAFAAVGSATHVAAGSVVRTDRGGLAEISYEDGSLTRIGPDTTYELTTLEVAEDRRQIVGHLEVGQTFHRVTKVTGSGSRFEVRTSNAVAAVRGTAFAVECRVVDVCDVSVTEGRVSVGGFGGGMVDVTAGQKVTVSAEGAVGELRPISPSDRWVALNTVMSPASAGSPLASVPAPARPETDPPSTEPSSSEPADDDGGPERRPDGSPEGSPERTSEQSAETPAVVAPGSDPSSPKTDLGVPESPQDAELESEPPMQCPGSQAEERRSDAADAVREECSACERSQALRQNCAGLKP